MSRRPIQRVQDNGRVKVSSPYDRPARPRDLHRKGRFGHQHAQNRG
ncbi:hypothetical protein ACIP79_32230 [Streptomyces sp. NPDC088747]